MLATTAATASVRVNQRIKLLDSRISYDDQKDLEAETEEQSEELVNGQPEIETEEQSGLSSRASDIKEYLKEKTAVKAVLLKKDGSVEEISYDASSSGTRSLLGGRPSIVGEIEDLNAVVVQSLEKSGDGAANQHTLPVPLCHNKGQSDYVLFRVDAVGKASDIALEEYQKYVDDHKTLTETAVKQRNFDEEPIASNSPFHSTSEISMESLRGALQTHFYDELTSAVDADPERGDAEIDDAVKQQIQQIVDDAVTAFTVSPMEDPNYSPEDDAENTQNEEVSLIHSFDGAPVDDREWREQLKDALDHIKEIGKEHGEAFAERICETFYEANGEAPTLDALSSLYGRIRTDFANEAEEELKDEEQSEAESESEEENDFGDEWDDALDHVRSIGRKDGRCLAQNICDLFNDVNGAEPSLSELHSVWQSIQDELAEEALEQDLEEEGSSSDEEQDKDAAYSPSNPIDSALASKDLVEDRKHDLEHFEQSMLNTPTVSSKRGGGVSWSVFFDESDLNEEAENSNLLKSVEGFKMRNQREPNQVEIHRMKLFLSVPNELVDEEEVMADSTIMTKSAVVASGGGGASWSVDFDESSGSLENAKRAFQRMYNREPTSSEQEQIRSFLAVPNALDSGSEEEQSVSTKPQPPSDAITNSLVAKKAATGYTLSFDDDEKQQNGDMEEAIKWFKRFNGRDPDDEELTQIEQFMEADQGGDEEEEDMVDIE